MTELEVFEGLEVSGQVARSFADLWPFSQEDFLGRFWSTNPCLVRGKVGALNHLMPWSVLDQNIYTRKLEDLRMRLVKEGAVADPSKFTQAQTTRRDGVRTAIDPTALTALLREGYTLVMDEVDRMHPALDDMIYSFEQALGERVQANLYAAWTHTKGFNIHWDDHDVYILQVYGRKKWMLYGMTRENPSYRDAPNEDEVPSTPVWEGYLEAGDVLYLPRGYWHAAEAEGQTLHLTVGVQNRTGVDFVRWLSDYLLRDVFFRGDIPFHGSDSELSEYVEQVGTRLQEALAEPGLMRLFEGQMVASLRHRTPVNLPASIEGAASFDSDDSVIWRGYGGRLRDEGETISFVSGEGTYRFKASARPLLEFLSESSIGGVSVQSLTTNFTDLGENQTIRLVEHLVKLGLVEIRSTCSPRKEVIK